MVVVVLLPGVVVVVVVEAIVVVVVDVVVVVVVVVVTGTQDDGRAASTSFTVPSGVTSSPHRLYVLLAVPLGPDVLRTALARMQGLPSGLFIAPS